MPSQQQIRDQLRDILIRMVPKLDSGLADDADIFEAGIDSVSAVLLLTEIEETFDISLESGEIPYESIRTLAGMAEFIESMQHSRG